MSKQVRADGEGGIDLLLREAAPLAHAGAVNALRQPGPGPRQKGNVEKTEDAFELRDRAGADVLVAYLQVAIPRRRVRAGRRSPQ